MCWTYCIWWRFYLNTWSWTWPEFIEAILCHFLLLWEIVGYIFQSYVLLKLLCLISLCFLDYLVWVSGILCLLGWTLLIWELQSDQLEVFIERCPSCSNFHTLSMHPIIPCVESCVPRLSGTDNGNIRMWHHIILPCTPELISTSIIFTFLFDFYSW